MNLTEWLKRTGPLACLSLFSVMFWVRVMYFDLEICLHPFLFPNKETECQDRVKLLFDLSCRLVMKDEMMLCCWY